MKRSEIKPGDYCDITVEVASTTYCDLSGSDISCVLIAYTEFDGEVKKSWISPNKIKNIKRTYKAGNVVKIHKSFHVADKYLIIAAHKDMVWCTNQSDGKYAMFNTNILEPTDG